MPKLLLLVIPTTEHLLVAGEQGTSRLNRPTYIGTNPFFM
jgi:hypothetical protein